MGGYAVSLDAAHGLDNTGLHRRVPRYREDTSGAPTSTSAPAASTSRASAVHPAGVRATTSAPAPAGPRTSTLGPAPDTTARGPTSPPSPLRGGPHWTSRSMRPGQRCWSGPLRYRLDNEEHAETHRCCPVRERRLGSRRSRPPRASLARGRSRRSLFAADPPRIFSTRSFLCSRLRAGAPGAGAPPALERAGHRREGPVRE